MTTLTDTFSLRPVTACDGPVVDAMVRAEHTERLRPAALSGLSGDAFETLVTMQCAAQAAQLAERHPHARHEAVLDRGTFAGRMVTDTTAAGIHLIDLLVAPEARRNGLGRAAVAALCGRADAGRDAIECQVWWQNAPALALYRRAGFRRTGGDETTYLTLRREPAPGKESAA